MTLLVVVAVVIIVAVVWRSRATRRLTIEESVDRYRRTLSAVHDASVRSRTGESVAAPAAPFHPRTRRSLGPPSRRVVAGAAIAVIALVVVAIAVTQHGSSHLRAAAPTTTRPPTTRASTTTVAVTTTTVPLVRPTDGTGTAFTIAKASYTVALHSNSGPCWVEMRDAGGASLFTGLLSNGASQSVTAGNATIRLGNPAAVTLTVDGTPVPFVTQHGAPVTLHLQATAA